MTTWLILLVVGLAALAAGLATHVGLGWVLEIGSVVARRLGRGGWRGQFLRQYLKAEPEASDGGVTRSLVLPYFLLPMVAGVIAALMARNVLLSPYLVLVGVAVAMHLRTQQRRAALAHYTDEVERLVVVFMSVFAVHESLSAALEAVDRELPPGQVRRAVHQTLSRLRTSQNVEAAVPPLTDLKNEYINQFVFVLLRLDSTNRETAATALHELEGRLRVRKRLRDRARTALVLLRGTVRTMQGANVAAVVIALSLPVWRSFFTSTPERHLIFVVVTTLAVLASLYFDHETRALEEQVL